MAATTSKTVFWQKDGRQVEPSGFRTNLFDVASKPGGCILCWATAVCPCVAAGNISEWVKAKGGWWSGFALVFIPLVCGVAMFIATMIVCNEVNGMLIHDGWWRFCTALGFFVVFYFIAVGRVTCLGQSTLREVNPADVDSSFCLHDEGLGAVKAFFCMWCYLCQIRREQLIAGRLLPVTNEPQQIPHPLYQYQSTSSFPSTLAPYNSVHPAMLPVQTPFITGTKVCQECNTVLPENCRFCSSCGIKIAMAPKQRDNIVYDAQIVTYATVAAKSSSKRASVEEGNVENGEEAKCDDLIRKD